MVGFGFEWVQMNEYTYVTKAHSKLERLRSPGDVDKMANTQGAEVQRTYNGCALSGAARSKP